jgi:hypothetical protein
MNKLDVARGACLQSLAKRAAKKKYEIVRAVCKVLISEGREAPKKDRGGYTEDEVVR